MSDGREILENWFRRVWNEQDSSAIEEMFPSPSTASGLGEQDLQGPKDFQRFQSALCSLVLDLEITIDRLVEDGTWFAAECTLSGMSKNREPVSIQGSTFCKIENGKILESSNHWDFMDLWVQNGLLPENCFPQGLSGQKVV